MPKPKGFIHGRYEFRKIGSSFARTTARHSYAPSALFQDFLDGWNIVNRTYLLAAGSGAAVFTGYSTYHVACSAGTHPDTAQTSGMAVGASTLAVITCGFSLWVGLSERLVRETTAGRTKRQYQRSDETDRTAVTTDTTREGMSTTDSSGSHETQSTSKKGKNGRTKR